MKTKHFFSLGALLLGILILLLATTNFNPHVAFARNPETSPAALRQYTPTPQSGNDSEIGSTDGILLMGVVIVLIVTLPLIFRKRSR